MPKRKSELDPGTASKSFKKLESFFPNDGKVAPAKGAVADKGKDSPSAPVILFAHGAGAGSSSKWMQKWKNILASSTCTAAVQTFDYPYIEAGRRRPPPKAEKLVDFHTKEMEKMREGNPGKPIILAGKSMGSRVSCLVAGQEGTPVAGVICFGYPLKGMDGSIRSEPLVNLKVPVLFLQGSKDALCPLDTLDDIRKKMKVDTCIHIVEGGDHSLECTAKFLKEVGQKKDQVDHGIIQAANAFIAQMGLQIPKI